MNFKYYMQFFYEDDTLLGDLSRDIDQDQCFPDTNDRKKLQSYLDSLNASYDARSTLDKALVLYKKFTELVPNLNQQISASF